ncbi:MAG: hypothetical protein PHN30_04745 [Bacteroidales bacterium]|nr:hypothetical protein [Bacteroidales bacterium]MDD3385003.1 hypothetical protein [Bacteroidales bacterium]MDD3871495.1 hypothetical protein [Bacteroidales bacterium]MDD4812703.1 hypothetical protein [Bacteroidales bacterium]NLO67460.1 hypothetical protein [Bacteroidales bacterium]
MKLLSGIVLMSLALVFSSCQKYPQAEVDQANAAIEAARVAEADVYAADEFTALKDSLAMVINSVEKEKSKLFSNYKEELTKLTSTVEMATSVAEKAQTKKVEMKEEATAILTELVTIIDQNTKMIAKAPRGKEGKAALELIQNELTSVQTGMEEASAKLESGDVFNGINQAKAIKEKAVSIHTELVEVLTKARIKLPF